MDKKLFAENEKVFTKAEAIAEASRCLQCENAPCMNGCPTTINIPLFVKRIKEDHVDLALETIKASNTMPFACSRLCPTERMCQGGCSIVLDKPIQIAKLERYAYENGKFTPPMGKKKYKKVAVIGSGPAGLSCSEDLAVLGYEVTIFEALHSPGGILRFGIPNFRFPHSLISEYISSLESLGVKIIPNSVVGRLLSLPELKKKFSAVFIATGSNIPTYMNREGEHLQNILTANEFLYRINMIEQHLIDPKNELFRPQKVIVVGGNDAGLDAARVLVRLGAKVTVLFERSLNEMEACWKNIAQSREEGIDFLFLCVPKRYCGKTKVETVEILQMKMEEDEIGNKVAVEIEGSEFVETADLVILSHGTTASPIVVQQSPISHNLRGNIFVDETLMTSVEGIFSGGAVTGTTTVVDAIALGKRAAVSIDTFLNKKEIEVKNE